MNVRHSSLAELIDNDIAQVLSGDGRRKVQVNFTKGLTEEQAKTMTKDMDGVELPKLEVTRRIENRSSKVARKSKGLWRPTRLLHPLPRDSSSSFASADFPLTRANPLGACNETTNIFSRIY